MPSNRDIALGRLAPKVLIYGDRRIEIPASAQVNQLTLDEKVRHVTSLKLQPLNRETAVRMGYGADEVAAHFYEPAVEKPIGWKPCGDCLGEGSFLLESGRGSKATIPCPFCRGAKVEPVYAATPIGASSAGGSAPDSSSPANPK